MRVREVRKGESHSSVESGGSHSSVETWQCEWNNKEEKDKRESHSRVRRVIKGRRVTA